MAKPVIKWPDCRCGWYPGPFYLLSAWDRTVERGERVPVPICRKNAGCSYWECYPYSPVRRCDHCKRLGSAKAIKVRSDCYDHERPEWGTPHLCMACWNRYRPIIYALRKLRECQRLANKIRRVARAKVTVA